MHCMIYRSLADRVTVKTVCSSTVEKASPLAEELGASVSTDFQETARDADIDLVDVCLPTYLHRQAAEAALAAGNHVFIEKPIALTLSDADAMIEAAGQSDGFVIVGHALRFSPAYVELYEEVKAGTLGKPLVVSTYRLSPPPDWNDWMSDSDLSGGVAVDLLVHDFDQMNWHLGYPKTVYARSGPHSRSRTMGHVVTVVEYESAIGVAEGSLAMPNSYPFTSNIRAVCDTGAAEYTFRAEPAEGVGNVGGGDVATAGLWLYSSKTEPDCIGIPPHVPWKPVIEYAIETVELGREPERGTAEQARAALAVCVAANQSLRTGRVEQVAR